MIRNTRNFVFFFSRFAKTVGSSKTIFDFLATDFSEWTGVNSRRSFAVCAGLLSTRPATRTPNPSSSSCYTCAFTYSPAIPNGKLTMASRRNKFKSGGEAYVNSSTRGWRVILSDRSRHLIKCPLGSSCCATLFPGKKGNRTWDRRFKCAMSRALIVTVRNASLLPRRLEHVYCAYSKTSAFRGCKSGTSFIDIVKKSSSLTLIRNHLKIASEAYFKRDQKTVVKCVLGDVWSKVTTE